MQGREAKILKAAVQEFIDTGEPVSSDWLYKRYDFGIKPAMIRLELERLSEKGFLEQPHRSAGRIPSDRGYEFLAQEILETEEPVVDLGLIGSFFIKHAWSHLVELLSEELELLGVASENGNVYKEGIENLVENLELETPQEIKAVIRDFVEIDARMDEAEKKFKRNENPQIFIGRKSPVTKSENLAVIAGDYKLGDEEVLLFAIGPKRMDYKKALKIFKNLNYERSR